MVIRIIYRGESHLVERLRLYRFPHESKTFFLYAWWMNIVGKPHKQLGAESYYYVMINSPIPCLTFNRLCSLMVGCENKQSNKKWTWKQTFEQKMDVKTNFRTKNGRENKLSNRKRTRKQTFEQKTNEDIY